MTTLAINEIFFSIQGESTRAGMPCVFVRLSGCHLRCSYCDTEYAFHEGTRQDIQHVLAQVEQHRCCLVEITGGEPLLQPNVHALIKALCDASKTVLIETSGACDVAPCDPRAIKIVDIKTPDSGEQDRIDWSVLDHLGAPDEVKFVICSRRDYDWARRVLGEHGLEKRVAAVLFSPVQAVPAGKELPGIEALPIEDLAQWVLEDRLPVRIQTQLHKQIWDPMA